MPRPSDAEKVKLQSSNLEPPMSALCQKLTSAIDGPPSPATDKQ